MMAIFNAPDWSSIAIVGLVANVIESAATPFLSLCGSFTVDLAVSTQSEP
ncbi:Uncharacterised protein [Acinetobacter baumannii]|nr:Uncharacterised protein [Acinetobacter baumannii]